MGCFSQKVVFVAVFSFFFELLFTQAAAPSNTTGGFVRVQNGKFVDNNCQELFFSGSLLGLFLRF